MDHFLSIFDTPAEQVTTMLDAAYALRAQREAGVANEPVLAGKTLAMIFEKPSLRTRVSFEQAMIELGGHAIVLGSDVGLGQRESVADVTRVLTGMVHGIAARVFEHDKLVAMARHSTVPVVNMLSDLAHPAQALADAMTIIDEFCPPRKFPQATVGAPASGGGGRDVSGKTVAFVGDGNNVTRSLAAMCGRLGMNFVLASPPAYALEQDFADRLMSQFPGMSFTMTHDPSSAVEYADVVYADTFVSMGQEAEQARRERDFEGFQVNQALLDSSRHNPIVLHCLPAHRGIEITDAVMDGPRSRVFPQAHNRLHAQKGLLKVLLGKPAPATR